MKKSRLKFFWLALSLAIAPIILAETCRPEFVSQLIKAHSQPGWHNLYAKQLGWGSGIYQGQSFSWYGWSEQDAFVYFALDIKLSKEDCDRFFSKSDRYSAYWSANHNASIDSLFLEKTMLRASDDWIDRPQCTRDSSLVLYLGECLEFINSLKIFQQFYLLENLDQNHRIFIPKNHRR